MTGAPSRSTGGCRSGGRVRWETAASAMGVRAVGAASRRGMGPDSRSVPTRNALPDPDTPARNALPDPDTPAHRALHARWKP